MLAQTIADALLADWLGGGQQVASQLPAGAIQSPPTNLPPPSRVTFFQPDEPIIRFPLIEQASQYLANLRVLPYSDFVNRDLRFKAEAFTVARIFSQDALQKIKEALFEDVQKGGTLDEFRGRVDDILTDEVLSDRRIENIYRTNVSRAYSEGMDRMLNHPLVTGEFPFEMTVPVRDSRLTPMCDLVSKSGLDGTGIFLRDDPEWIRLKPPRHYQCRCGRIALSLEDAANKYGIEYAIRWLKSGQQPPPEYVPRIPVDLPKGWIR